MQVLWKLALAWCFAAVPSAPPEPEPGPEVVILMHDARTGVAAGLWLGDRETARVDAIERDGAALWTFVRADEVGPAAGTDEVLGYSTGEAAASNALLSHFSREEVRGVVAAQVGGKGIAAFEGSAAPDVQIHVGTALVVIGRGVPRGLVRALGRQLDAVERDPIDLALAAAEQVTQVWPRSGGPRSGALVVHAQARAPEVLAVDRHGTVARRLTERHLYHLAVNEVPFQLGRARESCPSPIEACREATNAVLAAARRALEGRPGDRTLYEAIAEAEELAPPG